MSRCLGLLLGGLDPRALRGLLVRVVDLVLDVVGHILEALLELNDALPQAPPHFGESTPEQDEHDDADDDQLLSAERTDEGQVVGSFVHGQIQWVVLLDVNARVTPFLRSICIGDQRLRS